MMPRKTHINDEGVDELEYEFANAQRLIKVVKMLRNTYASHLLTEAMDELEICLIRMESIRARNQTESH